MLPRRLNQNPSPSPNLKARFYQRNHRPVKIVLPARPTCPKWPAPRLLRPPIQPRRRQDMSQHCNQVLSRSPRSLRIIPLYATTRHSSITNIRRYILLHSGRPRRMVPPRRVVPWASIPLSPSPLFRVRVGALNEGHREHPVSAAKDRCQSLMPSQKTDQRDQPRFRFKTPQGPPPMLILNPAPGGRRRRSKIAGLAGIAFERTVGMSIPTVVRRANRRLGIASGLADSR